MTGALRTKRTTKKKITSQIIFDENKQQVKIVGGGGGVVPMIMQDRCLDHMIVVSLIRRDGANRAFIDHSDIAQGAAKRSASHTKGGFCVRPCIWMQNFQRPDLFSGVATLRGSHESL